MDYSTSAAFAKGCIKRIKYWKTIKNPRELRNFDVCQFPVGYDYTAADIVRMVTNQSFMRMAERSQNEYSRKGQICSISAEMFASYHPPTENLDWEGTKRVLEHYIARIDHDFMFGLLTRPVRAGHQLIMSDPVFKLEIIDGPAPPTRHETDALHDLLLGSFDRWDRTLKIYSQVYRIPDEIWGSAWTQERFKNYDFTVHPTETRSLDEMLIAAVQVMSHIFLKLGSCYPGTGEARVRQQLDRNNTGRGEEWIKLVRVILENLNRCQVGGAVLEAEYLWFWEGCDRQVQLWDNPEHTRRTDEQWASSFDWRFPELRSMQQAEPQPTLWRYCLDCILILGSVSLLWFEWPAWQGTSPEVSSPDYVVASLESLLFRIFFLLGASMFAVMSLAHHHRRSLNGFYRICCSLIAGFLVCVVMHLIGIDPVSLDNISATQTLLCAGFEYFWVEKLTRQKIPRPRIDLAGDCSQRIQREGARW